MGKVVCANKDEWLQQRRKGLTGTDMAAIMGLSPYKSALDVFNNKVDGVEPTFSDAQLERMQWGKDLEGVVANKFFTDLEREHEIVELSEFEMLQHPKYQYMHGTPDAMFNTNDGLEVLEIKTTGWLSSEWGAQGTSQVPEHYKIQLAWYVMLTDAVRGHMAVFAGISNYHTYIYERDSELEKRMLEAAKDFWTANIGLGLPPMPSTDEDLKNLYPKSVEGQTSIAPAGLEAKIDRVKDIKKHIKELEAEQKDLEHEIKYHIGESEKMLNSNGDELANYKTTVRKTFDSKTFASENPDFYQKYLKETTLRTLKLK